MLTAIVTSLSGAGGEGDEPGIFGSQPPEDGDWHINETTYVRGQDLELNGSIRVKSSCELHVVGSNVSLVERPWDLGDIVVNVGGGLCIEGSLLDVGRMISHGALTEIKNSTIRARGNITIESDVLRIYDSKVENRALSGGFDEQGSAALLTLKGGKQSEFINVTILNEGGKTGTVAPGANGPPGGESHLVIDVQKICGCSIISRAGASSAGGLPLESGRGGHGGLGAESQASITTCHIEDTTIKVRGSDGGTGAHGANNLQGDGGHGGNGAAGGDATLSINSPSELTILGCTLEALSGAGGSGGNGGEARDGTGGTAGWPGAGGMAHINVSAAGNLTIGGTELESTAGSGGYGGDYGVLAGDVGKRGIPQPGGQGGQAVVEVYGKANASFQEVTITGRAGTGLDGGTGYDQGEEGGRGGDSCVTIEIDLTIEASGLWVKGVAGYGGNGGPAMSDIWGNGGDGGDVYIRILAAQRMYIANFTIEAIDGVGGKGNTPAWNGADGTTGLDLDTVYLELWNGLFHDLRLDDLHGDAVGYLYNVSFRVYGISELLPISVSDDALIWVQNPVALKLLDQVDISIAKPHVNWTVTVVRKETGEVVDSAITDEHGKCSFYLGSYNYSSRGMKYVGSYYFIMSSPDNKTTAVRSIEVRGPIDTPIIIIISGKSVWTEIHEPIDGRLYIFDQIHNRTLETNGDIRAPSDMPVVAVWVRLYPKLDDPSYWPWLELTKSDDPLSTLSDEEDRWGRFFPQEKGSNNWSFFYRFDIVGGDVTYLDEEYIYEVQVNTHDITRRSGVVFEIEVLPDPPTVTLTTSFEGLDWNTTSVQIEGTSSGAESIFRVEVCIDNGSWELAQGTSDWKYILYPSALSEGNHIFRVRAYDGRQYSTILEETFLVDKVDGDTNGGTTNGGGKEDVDTLILYASVVAIAFVLAFLLVYITKRRREG